MTLGEIFKKALRESWAVPHFNFSNLETLKAIAEAARETKSPVMVGTSEGERKFRCENFVVGLLKAYHFRKRKHPWDRR